MLNFRPNFKFWKPHNVPRIYELWLFIRKYFIITNEEFKWRVYCKTAEEYLCIDEPIKV